MIPVSYPGVYIQEVPSGVKTITGVATSITTFFGRAIKGPLNRAVRCLSHADFVRNFGGAPTGSELALAVKQFYDNGGSDCFIVRLAAGAQAAGVTLLNWDSEEVLLVRQYQLAVKHADLDHHVDDALDVLLKVSRVACHR